LSFFRGTFQGNLLDDSELIGVLAVTKATAAQVNQKLAGASEANRRISKACEEYRPVAHRAQLIYFLIAQFSSVNCMYQTSLAQVDCMVPVPISCQFYCSTHPSIHPSSGSAAQRAAGKIQT
jgi:dynein heavy chain